MSVRNIFYLVPLLFAMGCPPATVNFPPDFWPDVPPIATGDVFDTSDTGSPPLVPTIPAGVDVVAASCTPGGMWVIELTTQGWTDGATVVFRTPDGTKELHPMVLLDSDPNGAWDRYQLGPIAAGVPADEVVLGSSSAVECDASMALAILTTDRFGQLADCAAWGTDPQRLLEELVADLPSLSTCRAL